MKIGFYSPYLDSLGGGERYILTLASHWSRYHEVFLFWDDTTISSKAQTRFNIDLTHVSLVPNFFLHEPFIQKMFLSSQYDLIFSLSDGSVPTSCATYNILHFQVPFHTISFPFWKRMKVQKIICNSLFTKQAIDQKIGDIAEVIYPPVDIDQFYTLKKEKIILSVGRFSSHFQAKKQEVLIDIFKEGERNGALKGWRLVLAGGLLQEDRSYMDMLMSAARRHAITLIPNISFEALQQMYAKASIYWHAAGFEESNPEHMEHFGITTVEAMASGCIPIVYKAGGQPEIVIHEQNGFLWDSKNECLECTQKIIQSNPLRVKLQSRALITVKQFSSAHFCQTYDELLSNLVKR